MNDKEIELKEATTKFESQDFDSRIQILEESLIEKERQIEKWVNFKTVLIPELKSPLTLPYYE